MPKYQITAPDGNKYEVNAPEGATQEQVLAFAQQNYKPKQEPKEQGYSLSAPSLGNLGSNLATLGKGALAGAADIGDTLINASTYLPRQIESTMGGDTLNKWNQNRTQGLDQFNQNNSDDTLYNIGRIGGNIAGTAGVGGALGGTLAAASKTPRALELANALKTGGSAAGSLTNKVLGGVGSAALGSALIDPSMKNIETGAAIGGALPVVGAVAPKIGSAIADALGITTGAGGEAIKTAAATGMRGGQAADDFSANLRGQAPIEDVLNSAKQNLNQLRADRAQAYREGIADLSKDKTILDFSPISKAIDDQVKVGSFKGKVINESTADTQSKIRAIVDDWAQSNPAEYHTPEGLDALKKAVGDIRESTPFGTPSRKVADSVYNSIKKEITDQAPEYSKTMRGYQEASDQITEIEKALSLGNKASADTAMRKLQSLMRNNVNTNYGKRLELAKALETQGGQEILPSIAGQQLSNLAPRGLQGAIASATGVGGLALNPAFLATLPLQSPRVVGEAALKTGQMARMLKNGLNKVTPSAAALAAALNR